MIWDILLLIGAWALVSLSIKPLKKSSEFRFNKKKPLAEGLFYLGTAGLSLLFWSWWILLLGLPVAWGIKKLNDSDKKLLES